MTDRELLELAAKAAGVEGQYFESENGIHIHTGIYRPGLDYYWNPLISDSEALRLAVNLQFDLSLGHGGASVKICGRRILAEELCHPDSGEDLACARRAIVRAAAEIGRAMP
ncbi:MULTISPECIES: hypothetical protein [unclassified Pseudomonas]|uniref:hypothetical protein n=1 Tax=unclassified Pseudomonas TaxID=196821 RepID=UPI00244D6587|nr:MULTISPECIES: hypothetical protein [unclassified Pseudomonas]MDG9927462.1 hypothetical protein [Pseudomonas sp. GD04042]MDH0482531.1 hypothetical protein [Pseudomonas sp. GD04015]MDH0602883.1 hypothetical protein [Pseudomonas sp. GD03869]